MTEKVGLGSACLAGVTYAVLRGEGREVTELTRARPPQDNVRAYNSAIKRAYPSMLSTPATDCELVPELESNCVRPCSRLE